MSALSLARLALAAIGIVVWGYGYQRDLPGARLTGMALIALALLLRFAGPRSPRRGESSPEE